MFGTASTAISVIQPGAADNMLNSGRTHISAKRCNQQRLRVLNGLIGLLLLTSIGWGQSSILRSIINYRSGDVVYVPVGVKAGLEDSALVRVISRGDTIATMRVFAVSSRSAACTIVGFTRQPAIGDTVIAFVQISQPEKQKAVVSASHGGSDSASSRAVQETRTTTVTQTPSFLSLKGRVGIQYLTLIPAGGSFPVTTQPSLVLQMEGKFNDAPLKFNIYSDFRSLAYGTNSPFSSQALNQNRLYRFSLEYDDGSNRAAVGRIIPPVLPSTGFVDGIFLARKLDNFILGASAGYEPTFSLQTPSTAYKKFSVFASLQPDNGIVYSLNASYGRTYYYSNLDREVVSGSASYSPTYRLYFMAQSDIDLKTPRAMELVSHAKLTNLYGSVNYRFTDVLSLGAGITAWRPFYQYSYVTTTPDSLLDETLRTSPSINIQLNFIPGIMFYTTYAPRSSTDGFGAEYNRNSSFGISNLFGQGIYLRTSMITNVTFFTRMNTYLGSVQRSILFADVTVRYQYDDMKIPSSDINQPTKVWGIDCLMAITRSLSFYGTVEHSTNISIITTTVLSQLSYRF